MPHGIRPKVDPRYPLQVTIRAAPGLPSLRSARVFGALRAAIARASVDRFRVIHFSIQQDHGHFIVEGDEARRARGGMHGLAIRLALAVNASSAARVRSWAIVTTSVRSRRRGRRGRAWSTCYSTSASISARPPASTRGARVPISPGGTEPQRLRPARPPRFSPRRGWRPSVGSARAVGCASRSIRPPRPDRTRLDSAGVAPTPVAPMAVPRGCTRTHAGHSPSARTRARSPARTRFP